jgi:hypothetical protein
MADQRWKRRSSCWQGCRCGALSDKTRRRQSSSSATRRPAEVRQGPTGGGGLGTRAWVAALRQTGSGQRLYQARAAWRGRDGNRDRIGQSIPCRLRARALAGGASASASVWVRRAEAAAGCKRNEDEANRSGDSDGSRLWALAKGQTSTVECQSQCQCRRADRRVRRSEGMRGEEDREAESTHHLLRRYRRRLCLILPGPIWGMRQRHVDSESALE